MRLLSTIVIQNFSPALQSVGLFIAQNKSGPNGAAESFVVLPAGLPGNFVEEVDNSKPNPRH